jgi:hypothetical protein
MCHLCFVGDLFQYVLTIKEGCSFFKSPVLSLDEEEPQEDEFDSEPADIYELNMTVEKKKFRESVQKHT